MSEARRSEPQAAAPDSPASSGRRNGGSFRVARVHVQELSSLGAFGLTSAPATELLSDELLLERVMSGEHQLRVLLMRRSNPRIFRIARSVVGSESEAEVVMLATYLRAFGQLDAFEARVRFASWLSQIALEEAQHHAQAAHGSVDRDPSRAPTPDESGGASAASTPASAGRGLARSLQAAIDRLPEELRIVFTMRVLEQMGSADVADIAALAVSTVNSRVFSARLALRRALGTRFDDAELQVFDFRLSCGERVIEAVQQRFAVADSAQAASPSG